MKPRPTITYAPELDGFVLVMLASGTVASRAHVLSPDEAPGLRVDLRREMHARSTALRQGGR